MKKFCWIILFACLIVTGLSIIGCVEIEKGEVVATEQIPVEMEEVTVEDNTPREYTVQREVVKKKLLKKRVVKVVYDKNKGIPGWYRVQLGDTLPDISRRVYGTALWAEEICHDNGIEYCEYLEPGKLIKLYPRES